MSDSIVPSKLALKKDARLDITWSDGVSSTYTISYLRTMCPCAACKIVREGVDPHSIAPVQKKKPLLTILPGNYADEITITSAEKVGNYALKLAFSDGHDTGIYSFAYLRDIHDRRSATT